MLRGLTTITYQADDLAAARQWYSEFLGIDPYFNRPEYIEFRLGDYEHELGILDGSLREVVGLAPQASAAPTGAIAYWHVDDIEAKLADVTAAGATVKEAAHDVGGGRLVATVTDPDGNVLGLLQDA